MLDGQTQLAVVAAHTSPFPQDWYRRDVQVRQLGLEFRHVSSDIVVLVAGDMNAGLAYRDDTWTTAQGEVVRDLYANGATWALGQYYGGYVDAFARANGVLDDDVASGVVADPSQMERTPYGIDGWCSTERRAVFTGSDCNTLYFRQYAGQEPPARLDHLWLRDVTGRVHVAEARTAFTEPEVSGENGSVELSDHSGLFTRLLIAPP